MRIPIVHFLKIAQERPPDPALAGRNWEYQRGSLTVPDLSLPFRNILDNPPLNQQISQKVTK